MQASGAIKITVPGPIDHVIAGLGFEPKAVWLKGISAAGDPAAWHSAGLAWKEGASLFNCVQNNSVAAGAMTSQCLDGDSWAGPGWAGRVTAFGADGFTFHQDALMVAPGVRFIQWFAHD